MGFRRPPRKEKRMSPLSLDPYSPAEMAQKAETGGVKKAGLSFADTFLLGVLAGAWIMDGNKVGATALATAAAKCNLSWSDAFMRGVYCNALVCLAVWLAYSARTTTDKVLSIVFPITAFVAAGFEHSIANMYF